MRIEEKKRIFIVLSCLLLQSDAKITCVKGYKGTVEIPQEMGMTRNVDEVSDFQCDDGDMCAQFEVQKMRQGTGMVILMGR